MHIPKCAGLSVTNALQAALPPGSLSPRRYDATVFCNFDQFDTLPSRTRAELATTPDEVAALAGHRAVVGHFSLPTLLQITSPSSIATVLREPRARILSVYAYWRVTSSLRERWFPYAASEHAMRPLDDFLSEPLIAPATDNQICRFVLQGDSRVPVQDFIRESDTDALAIEAVRRLDSLGFVGVIELEDSVWSGLSRMFGVPLVPVRSNVTGQDRALVSALPDLAQITDRTLELIRRRSAADAIVYDCALSRAGVAERDRRRLSDAAFASQLVRLGDVLGASARFVADLALKIEGLERDVEEQRGLRAEIANLHGQLASQEIALEAREDDLDGYRHALEAMQRTLSWRVSAPLRSVRRLASVARSLLLRDN